MTSRSVGIPSLSELCWSLVAVGGLGLGALVFVELRGRVAPPVVVSGVAARVDSSAAPSRPCAVVAGALVAAAGEAPENAPGSAAEVVTDAAGAVFVVLVGRNPTTSAAAARTGTRPAPTVGHRRNAGMRRRGRSAVAITR